MYAFLVLVPLPDSWVDDMPCGIASTARWLPPVVRMPPSGYGSAELSLSDNSHEISALCVVQVVRDPAATALAAELLVQGADVWPFDSAKQALLIGAIASVLPGISSGAVSVTSTGAPFRRRLLQVTARTPVLCMSATLNQPSGPGSNCIRGICETVWPVIWERKAVVMLAESAQQCRS